MEATNEKKSKLEMPAKTIKIRIEQNEYEIKMPTNGQRIDIESAKVRITGGASRDLMMGSTSAQDAWILSEAITTFSILIPKLKEDLLVNLMDLNALQSKSIVKAFEKFYEWDQAWYKFLNQDEEDEEKK
jgi:hypothetical protein